MSFGQDEVDEYHAKVSQNRIDFGFFTAANAELKRARTIHPGEEGALTDAEWLTVLVEEVGECARAMQDETDERLRTELVQVAAMAARWANSIPAGRVRVPWAPRDLRAADDEGRLH